MISKAYLFLIYKPCPQETGYMNTTKMYKRLAKSFAQLASLTKMYNFDHPMVKEKSRSVYKEICDLLETNKQSIVLARSADMLLINGEKIEPEDKLMAKFIEDFIGLDIGSIELAFGIAPEELDMFIYLICKKEHVTGAAKIKEFLSGKKIMHLIARAATFKLVQENEDIVKKGDFIRVEELPPEILEKFSKDFTDGKVSERLKTADKNYKIAAHNSTFLAGLTFNLLKEKDAPEDLEKILWVLADYLINEIDTFKEEEMNREVLEDIKKKLLSMWKDKPEKEKMLQSAEKTYAIINSALQLKGLTSIYNKHKKELETTIGKIKKILANIPADSQLYKKTMANLAEIGED
jgi:hypothetical protein